MVAAFIVLDDASARELQTGGVPYLNQYRMGRDGTNLSAWLQTPIRSIPNSGDPQTKNQITADGGPMYADAIPRCEGNDILPRETVMKFYDAIEAPGAYYSTFNHGEGLIMLIPSMNMAAYFYFG